MGQDSSGVHQPRMFISADSAVIVSPKHKTALTGASVSLTVVPRCPVSRVDLLAHYFPGRTDTLARLNAPPYSLSWDYSALSDQSQLHLQFGYVLYHINGDTIVSSPTPHHWIINRITTCSRKRYVCKQVAPENEFVIDGNLDDWKRFRKVLFPSGSGFRCSWTPADLYCAIEVYDPVVTPGDRVELCLDMTRSRTLFLDSEHRIISFGPQSRSFSWAIDLSDTDAVQIDSIIVRIKEEMEWRCWLTPTGYVIEARVPFCILSTLVFPPKIFGFDIAVVNADNADIRTADVYAWSGAEPAARHTPAEWGAIVLRQRFAPLKGVLVVITALCVVVVALMVFLLLYRQREDCYYEKLLNKKQSPALQKIAAYIEGHCTQTTLSPADVACEINCSVKELEKRFHEELATTCSRYIQVIRIRKAKQLLAHTDKSMDEIRKATGFKQGAEFVRTFSALAGIGPEQWRENRLEDNREEDEGEE